MKILFFVAAAAALVAVCSAATGFKDIDDLISFNHPNAKIINLEEQMMMRRDVPEKDVSYHAGLRAVRSGSTCGDDDAFFQSKGVYYRFPSAGDYPKIGFFYRQDGHTEVGTEKAAEYFIRFDQMYFETIDTNDDVVDRDETDFSEFHWNWLDCDIRQLTGNNGQINNGFYFVLQGVTKSKGKHCYGVDIYVSYGQAANDTATALKFVVQFYNHVSCRERSFSQDLNEHNRLGVKFAYTCEDDAGGEIDCPLTQSWNEGAALLTSLTYKESNTHTKALSAVKACWAKRADNSLPGGAVTDNNCINAGTTQAGKLQEFGFSFDYNILNQPVNQKSFYLDLDYDLHGKYVSDTDTISFDPFVFRYDPNDFVVPTFPYTPPMLEESFEEEEEEEEEELREDVIDFAQVETREQKLEGNSTFRDVSLFAIVGFLGLSLVATYFYKTRSVDTAQV